MKTKSWMTMSVVIGGFILASCQSTLQTTLIDKKAYPPPKVLIEPLPDTDNDGVPDDIDVCPGTPKGVEVDPYGCPAPVDLADTVTMSLRVFFERSNYELQAKFLPEVEKVAQKITHSPDQIFVLSGHISEPEVVQISVDVDEKMNQEKSDNRQLGRKRAQVIKSALVKRGVAANKVYTFDCADNMPIAPNDTEEGTSMNQRIYGEAILVDDFLLIKLMGVSVHIHIISKCVSSFEGISYENSTNEHTYNHYQCFSINRLPDCFPKTFY